jgi:amino acid transporter
LSDQDDSRQRWQPPHPRPGEDYVRIPRKDLEEGLRPAERGRLVATQKTEDEAQAPVAGLAHKFRVFFTGRPLNTEAQETERLSIPKALPLLSSDALSSVAYGPEAGLAVLATAGAAAFVYNIPIGLAIALLMIIVTTSYRQVVHGYQGGGGSYAVARANLGLIFGLVAAAALLVDYVLTVAVSISSGVDALASAFAVFMPYKVVMALVILALVMIANLRGAREAGAIFAGPTYLFVATMLILIAAGVVEALVSHHAPGHFAPVKAETALVPLLILTAFASGSSSMTGIEAVSNSVPSFRPPEAAHAARTLTILGSLLVVLFLGVVAIDFIYAAEPQPNGNPTILSQLASTVFHGPAWPVYYVFQFATLLILVLAANTSFNGLPRLGAILARDDFLPHRFAHLGNRLVYSTGIVLLAVAAGILGVVFQGSTDAMINLYALGVFTAFTLAQSGMALHWWRERTSGWQRKAAINGFGAVITAIVTIIIIITKGPRGAWVVLVLVPLLVLMFLGTSRHYRRVRIQLARVGAEAQAFDVGPAMVPFLKLDAASRAALWYAMVLSPRVIALHPARNQAAASRFQQEWQACRWPDGHEPPELDLYVGRRPGRIFAILGVLDRLREEGDGRPITVVVPEWESRHLIRGLLDRPQAALFKLALLRRRDVVVASIPAQPGAPERRPEAHPVAIVPIANMQAPARRALAYAVTVASEVTAVHVETGTDEAADATQATARQLRAWKHELARRAPHVPVRLIVVESPYRSIIPPVLAYIDSWRKAHPEPICTVVLPEVVVEEYWALGLHNHRGFWLKAALLTRPTIAVADVTFHVDGHA